MTTFADEIDRLRRPDQSRRDGKESNAQFAARVGLTGSHITRYRQGTRPTVESLQQIVERLGLPDSELTRLFMIAYRDALPDGFSPLTVVKVPIYQDPVVGDDDEFVGEPESYAEIAGDMLGRSVSSGEAVGIILSDERDGMACSIPCGSVIYIGRVQWSEEFEFEPGAVYAIRDESGAVHIAYLVNVGGAFIQLYTNPAYGPVTSWTTDASRLIVGRVFGYRGDVRNRRASAKALDEVTTQLNWLHVLRRIWWFRKDDEEFFAFLDRAGIALQEYHAWIIESGLDLPARRVEQIIRALGLTGEMADWLRVGEAPPTTR